MRGRKKEKLDTLTFEERIDMHKKEIERLQKLIPLRDYFKLVTDQRYSYIVEVRKKVAEDLVAEGYSLKEIGRVFRRGHDTIIALLKIVNRQDIEDVVQENYKKWIEEKVYPVSQQQEVLCAESKTGRTTLVLYALASTKEEIKKIKVTKLWIKKEKRFYGNTNN